MVKASRNVVLFAIQRFRMTVFDAIKNGIASVGDPFKQFHGVGFEQSSLAKLPPVWDESAVCSILLICSFFIERTRRTVNSFVCKRLHGIWHLFLDSERYPDYGIS